MDSANSEHFDQSEFSSERFVMIQPIILRSNRFLGNNLVNHDLISLVQLEEANNLLLDKIDAGNAREASLLRILMWELEYLKESDLLNMLIDKFDLGMVDLGYFEMPDGIMEKINIDDCWASWTVPFDYENDFYFLATSYYLSQPVIDFWTEKLGSRILWFGAEHASISTLLDSTEQKLKPAMANS